MKDTPNSRPNPLFLSIMSALFGGLHPILLSKSLAYSPRLVSYWFKGCRYVPAHVYLMLLSRLESRRDEISSLISQTQSHLATLDELARTKAQRDRESRDRRTIARRLDKKTRLAKLQSPPDRSKAISW